MKKLFTLLVAVLLMATLWAQSPEKMSYQSVIRDASGNLITDTQVGMQISILQDSASGTEVYVETHTPTTNANGLVSIEIGTGTVVDGDFTTIDWANGPYFIKTETAVEAPLTSYTITGTSQLLSVPYALHAKTAETVTGGITETDPVYGSSVASGITGTDTTNWNNKLDSYTETDPSVPGGTQTGEMQYWDGTEWITIQPGFTGQTLTFVNGVPIWIGDTLQDVVANPATGKIWMDRNLGASQVATSSTDAASYGDLYQWGRAADGHESRTSDNHDGDADGKPSTYDESGAWDGKFITTGTSPYDWLAAQNDNLWQGVSGTNNPCPSGYRLPTEAEWEAERQSWSSNNAAGAFASPLKLPVAGSRNLGNGSLLDVDSYGYYWSSTVSSTNSRRLRFRSSSVSMSSRSRAHGFSVRCLKD